MILLHILQKMRVNVKKEDDMIEEMVARSQEN